MGRIVLEFSHQESGKGVPLNESPFFLTLSQSCIPYLGYFYSAMQQKESKTNTLCLTKKRIDTFV
jgi:hypothetical protein